MDFADERLFFDEAETIPPGRLQKGVQMLLNT
jgi:hypothetical protein